MRVVGQKQGTCKHEAIRRHATCKEEVVIKCVVFSVCSISLILFLELGSFCIGRVGTRIVLSSRSSSARCAEMDYLQAANSV